MTAPLDAVPRRFGVGARDKLGEGGESEVFALDAHRALRCAFVTEDPAVHRWCLTVLRSA